MFPFSVVKRTLPVRRSVEALRSNSCRESSVLRVAVYFNLNKPELKSPDRTIAAARGREDTSDFKLSNPVDLFSRQKDLSFFRRN